MQEEDIKANAQRDETAKALNEAHKKSHEEGGEVELDFDNLAEGTTYKKFEETERTKLAGIAEEATKYPDTGEQAFLDADHTKLNGIDTGATDDQTGAEIKSAYEGEADTNAYDDAAVTKLASIEVGASSTTVVAAADGITVTHRIMRVIGPVAPVDITKNPQIAAGSDGQIVIIQGCHDTYTVKIDDGDGVITAGSASRTLGDNDMLTMVYDSGETAWIETSYSNNHG